MYQMRHLLFSVKYTINFIKHIFIHNHLNKTYYAIEYVNFVLIQLTSNNILPLLINACKCK